MLAAVTGTWWRRAAGLTACPRPLPGPDGVSHWGDAQVLVSLAASVVLLVSFVLIERRSSRPLLPMRLLADRSRSGAYLIMLCIATGLFGVFFFLTLFIQNVLGYSAIRAGIAFLPFAVGVVIASALACSWCPDRPTAADRGF
jgi:predicted MFS family arabinose efflux permease